MYEQTPLRYFTIVECSEKLRSSSLKKNGTKQTMITTKYLFMYKYRLIDMCIDMSVYTYVYICVQLGNSFGNTKMKKGANFIRFQWGNWFSAT